MILVIADDFTGAAEIGGIGLRFGMQVEVNRGQFSQSEADLLIFDTDSRSVSESDAINKILALKLKLNSLKFYLIYKKVDSVLRGHVAKEIQCLMEILNKNIALLIPAKPSMNRIISERMYFIDEQPLHLTDFSKDPEHGVTTSDVTQLLGRFLDIKIGFLNTDDSIPENQISIGETKSVDDLSHWAEKIDDDVLPAGAADFFETLLRKKFSGKHLSKRTRILLGKRVLMVCGSSSDRSREALSKAIEEGKPVVNMPDQLFFEETENHFLFEQWVEKIALVLKKHNSAIVAINQPVTRKTGLAKRLRELTAVLTEKLLHQIKINELFVEGGATASEIMSRLGWQRFIPLDELAPGVVRMKLPQHPNLYLAVKPGSYHWPREVWNLFEK